MKIGRRALRRLGWAAGLLVLFTITGFLILPPIVKTQLERRLSATLGRRVTVEKVRINPYALTLTLEGFAILEPDGTSRFLAWRRLFVNFEALASLRREWVIGDVELDGFDARARINADQSFNFSDILAKLEQPAAATESAPRDPARPVRIARLDVTDARVELADQSRAQPFATVLGPLTFTISEFRTVSERGAPYRFEATTEAGERLSWVGTFQAQPLRSLGEFAVNDVVLPKYAPYYADRLQADLAAGTVSLRGRYEMSLTSDRVLKLLDGAVQLRGLRLLERGTQQPAIELPELDITGIEADVVAQKARVASVVLGGGRIQVRRERDGGLNLLAMLQPPGRTTAPPATSPAAAEGSQRAAPPGASVQSPSAQRPDVSVGELTLKGFRVQFDDRSAPRISTLTLHGLDVSLKEISLAGGATMPFQAAFGWEPEGSVRVEGKVGFNPVAANLRTETTSVALLPLNPYIEQFCNAHLTQGTVSTKLTVEVAAPPEKPLSAAVAGDVTVDQLGLVDAARNEELAGFRQLALRGLRASSTPEINVALDELNLAGSYGRVVLNPDKTLNLVSVATRPGPTERTPVGATSVPVSPPEGALAAASPAPNVPKIEVGRIVLSEGDYRFTDRSLEPNVTTSINQFGGTIVGISSLNPAKAELALNAMVDGAGPISIRGKVDPLGEKKSVDLKIDFKNVDLLPLSPYSGKYAGYELARGKLQLDVNLRVEGPKIDAANVVTLNQFTFGNAVKSADATSLPVRLGVALLKDLDGKIVIDVPVQGSTDDPQFRVGKVVLRVIVNLLTKAAVSPFSLLGAAFGGGGDELAFQDFEPGTAELKAAEVTKLETMVKALANRPGLSLNLEGGYDARADSYALKRKKLADRVRRAIWEARHQTDASIPPPEKLEITGEEHLAMVKKLYEEKFPPGTEFGSPIPPPPAIVGPPAPPAGVFRRIAYAITFRAQREQRAAEQENARLNADHQRAVAAALAAGLPLDEMIGRLAETVTVDENDLRGLAQARAQRVRDYFANVGKIAPERLFLTTTSPDTQANTTTAGTGKGPRVFLHLQ